MNNQNDDQPGMPYNNAVVDALDNAVREREELRSQLSSLREAHGSAVIAQAEAVKRAENAEQTLRDNTSILHEEARIYYDRAIAAEIRLEAAETQFRIMLNSQGCTARKLEEAESSLSLYATAARAIALHLEEFCDESLPYDQMIADAARKAASTLAATRQNAQQFAEASSLETSELGGCVDDLTELNNQHCNTIGQLEEQLDTIEVVLIRTEAELNAANKAANESQERIAELTARIAELEQREQSRIESEHEGDMEK